MSACGFCTKPLMPGKLKCLFCGSFNVSETGALGGAIGKSKTTTLDQITAKAIDRLMVGEPWDEVWGGGIVPTSSTLVGGAPGGGKSISLDTPLPKSRGWTTMGEVCVGDVILDHVGRDCRVVACSDVMHDHVCFEVEFSDGSRLVADRDHLWTVDFATHESSWMGRVTWTTGEILAGLGRREKFLLPEDRVDESARRRIVGVRGTLSVPVRCIAVDSPLHLFLVGRSRVPTHNTTGLLQILSKLALVTGKRAYLMSAEQGPGDIRITADRLKLPNIDQFRVLSEFGTGGAEIDESLLKEDPPAGFCLDSVSALCGKDVHAAIVIARRFKGYAEKFKAPAFLICHMTKEHDFAGLMALQHEVDTLFTVFPEEDGRRHVKAWKNRFGPTHAEYFLQMTELGLSAIPKKEKKGKKASSEDDGGESRMGRSFSAGGFEPPPVVEEHAPAGPRATASVTAPAMAPATAPATAPAKRGKKATAPAQIQAGDQTLVKIDQKKLRRPPLPAPKKEPPTAAERAAATKKAAKGLAKSVLLGLGERTEAPPPKKIKKVIGKKKEKRASP